MSALKLKGVQRSRRQPPRTLKNQQRNCNSTRLVRHVLHGLQHVILSLVLWRVLPSAFLFVLHVKGGDR